MKDFAVVHVTDLHYPGHGDAEWKQPFMLAVENLPDDNLDIRGIAVTGDLVNSPNDAGFKNVAAFLKSAGAKLWPAASPEERTQRTWVVDGNHDYRAIGNIKVTQQGIETGGHFRRFDQYRDPGAPLFLFGLNSCATGSLARGGVAHKDLERARSLARHPGAAFKSARYRIALIHHHLLPLPSQPREQLNSRGVIDDLIFDPGFKLLKNGALVTRYLLEGEFDLVLHGHEHQAFVASVNYLDLGAQPRALAILGGVAARDGFQVIRFRTRGDVVIERHSYVRHHGAFEKQPGNIQIWSHTDWRKIEWARASKSDGLYKHLKATNVLSAIGDVEMDVDIGGISAGFRQRLPTITRQLAVRPEELGTCEVTSVIDRQQPGKRWPLPQPGANITHVLQLEPPATDDQAHNGFTIKDTYYNGFAVSKRDASLRNLACPEERDIFSVSYPTEEVEYRFEFPRGFQPDNVRLEVIDAQDVTDAQDKARVDPAETQRARRGFRYEGGVIKLDLEWVLPRHSYEMSWDLPDAPRRNDDAARRAIISIRSLFSLKGTHAQVALGERLRVLRDRICRDHLGCSPVEQDKIGLGLFAFDESTHLLRWVAGTHDASSAFRSGTLPWGAGVRGLAMRRRRPEFRPPFERRAIYRTLSGCRPEAYILAVPIPAPWEKIEDESIANDPVLPCVVVTLSSLEDIPHMRILEEDNDRLVISTDILKSVVDILPTAMLSLEAEERRESDVQHR